MSGFAFHPRQVIAYRRPHTGVAASGALPAPELDRCLAPHGLAAESAGWPHVWPSEEDKVFSEPASERALSVSAGRP